MSTVETSRTFPAKKDDGSIVLLCVRKPTRSELEYAERESSRLFNASLRHGLPTRTRQLRDLMNAGLWTKEDEAALADATVKLREIENRLAAATTNEERAAIREERAPVYAKFDSYRRDIDQMLSHTCDAKAESGARTALICCTVEYAATDDTGAAVNADKRQRDGTMARVWKDADALIAEIDSALLNRVVYEYQYFINGLPSNWEADSGQVAGTQPVAAPAPEAPEAAAQTAPDQVAPAEQATASPAITPAAEASADQPAQAVPA